MDVNKIHQLERPHEKTDILEDTCPKLEEQDKKSKTYHVHDQFGVMLSDMFPHVITVDTSAGLSFVDKTVLTVEMGNRIEPWSGIMLRCA